ncbi:MAG: hypothetical protein RIT14_2892 [Pseudomonadota bacterium]
MGQTFLQAAFFAALNSRSVKRARHFSRGEQRACKGAALERCAFCPESRHATSRFGDQNLALADMVCPRDDTLFLHLLHQARGLVITDAQLALDV